MPVTSLLHYAGQTDQGRQRSNNEDRYFGDPERGLFVVVDGMGGQAAGEVAAETAVTLIRERLERRVGSIPDRIREAIAVANNEIFEQSQNNPAWLGMACVLTVAVVEDGQVTVGHVGDSRLYLLEPGSIRKVTHDHSPVGEREDRNELSEAEAMRHPRRNEVFRDVGSAPHTPSDPDFIEIQQLAMPPAGALLLCSDGLSDLVGSQTIRETVERNAVEPERAVRELIEAANTAGGKDNITVLLVEAPEYRATLGRAAMPAGALPPSARPLWWLWLLGGLAAGVAIGWLLHQRLVPRPPVADENPPPHVPQTIHVAADQVPTITAALAKAAAGDTILVSPGTYRESIALVDGVSLLSEKPQQAILLPVADGPLVKAEQVSHGRLSGFRITDEPSHPLSTGLLLRNADVEVTDLDITHARTAAVEITGNSRAVLRGNRFTENPGGGVIVRGTAEPQLQHNLIAGNGLEKGHLRPGVEVTQMGRPVLTNNILVDNGAEAIWKGAWGDDARLLKQNYFGSDTKSPAKPKIRATQPQQ